MYYLELFNFPTTVLTDQYQRPESNGTTTCNHWPIKIEFFKQEIIDFFLDRNLELKDGGIFRKSAGATGAVHTDTVWDASQSKWMLWRCAVNINLDNTNSLMYWISTTATEVYPPVKTVKLAGIHYGTRNNNKFQEHDDYNILDSFCITTPTLVRTDVAHSVKNLDNKDRWCISLRFKGNPPFEECAKKLCV